MQHGSSAAHEAADTSERAFNPFRQPATEPARSFISAVVAELECYEVRYRIRQRRRRPVDHAAFVSATQAVACDLAANTLGEGGTGIFASRSNRDLASKTRYDHPANTRQFPNILDALSSEPLSMVDQQLGGEDIGGKRRRTVIRAGRKFVDLMSRAGLQPADFRVVPGGETIVLKRARHDFWDKGGYLEYSETQETRALRDELSKTNAWLAQANLSVRCDDSQGIDLTDRQLRRVFTQGRFDCGGRLFGGFWQPMPKRDRLRSLQIDGEAILEVDYGQIMPRLVYGMYGVCPPMDDLYAIPGFEDRRPGIKKVMCSMLFNREPVAKMPKGTRQLFAREAKVSEVVRAIEAAHPAIKTSFGSGIGHRCQFVESQILMSVLERLRRHGITALPIHDAVLVPASAANTTQQVMLEVFWQHTGADGVVEIVGR